MKVKEGLVYNNSNGEVIGFCDSKSVNNYLTCIETWKKNLKKIELLYYFIVYGATNKINPAVNSRTRCMIYRKKDVSAKSL